MPAIIYIVEAVLQYLLVTAFLLRLVLPLARVNMRNQLAQAVIRVTNPLVMPLRRVLPPIGRVDTASVVAIPIDSWERVRRSLKASCRCCLCLCSC